MSRPHTHARRRAALRAATVGALIALAAPRSTLRAQSPAPVKLEQYTLPNGLKVILSEDHAAQVVAVDVWYDVGSRNEVPGRTGFAHLFEHMMYQGSAHVKKAEHFQLISRAGGSMNGSTAEDRTNYWQALPSNRVNLGLWLEADRMRSLAVTDSNLHNQREAVKEERRMRVDNQAYMHVIYEDQFGVADTASCFPYAHSIIGSMQDLDAASVEDVRGFFKQYYAPNNATLVVAGDFDPAQVKAMIQQYYADIPSVPAPAPVACNQKFSPGLVRRVVPDAKATLPAVYIAYRIPAYSSPETPALTLLNTILGQGESSRLNRQLVRTAKSAAGTQTLMNPAAPRRGVSIFGVFAVANQGVSTDTVSAQLAAEIARVSAEGVTEAELTKAKNAYRAGIIDARQHALAVAESIHFADLYLGSADAINSEFDRYMKVTADDVKRAAATYLVPSNALVLLITPESSK
jgi:zinc protease